MYQFHPLENEKQLEYLIRDILALEYINYCPFDLYGARGQVQHGNDIIGYNEMGYMVLAQVKKKSIYRNGIKKELIKDLKNELESILKHFSKDKINTIYFVSTYGRDKEIQDKARELTTTYGVKIIYWGWDTIAEKVSAFSEIQKKYFYQNLPVLLTTLPENPHCIGRENEFSKIKTMLEEESIVNIQSIGGMGKSTLANAFVHHEKEKYDFIGYISIDDSLEEALLRNLNHFFHFSKNDDIENIIYKLQFLNGKKLLIIDNLLYQKDIIYIKKLSSTFKIIITSRVLFNDIKFLKLKHLGNESLKSLFYEYNDQKFEDAYLDELFDYLDYHTLFIGLTSKTINRNNLTLENILNEFRNGQLPIIKVEIDLDTCQEKIYNDYLKKLFEESIKEIDDNNIHGLIWLSLFPSINLHTNEINRIFDRDLSNELLFLSKKGWLISSDKSTFKMHQIIKEFFLFNFPVYAQDAIPIITFYLHRLEWNEMDHPKDQQEYILFAKSLIDALNEYDEGVALLANNLAMLYRYFGFYDLALKYMSITEEFDKMSCNEPGLAQTYNNISQIYSSMKNKPLARKYNQLSLDLREKRSRHNIEENYLSLCNDYIQQEDYKNAKIYLNKLLELEVEVDIRSLIPIYNTAILYYTYTHNLNKALEYVQKALEHINSGKVDKKHLYIAYTYGNIGEVYILKENFPLAIEYKQKARQHIIDNFDINHPDLKHIDIDLDSLTKFVKSMYNDNF